MSDHRNDHVEAALRDAVAALARQNHRTAHARCMAVLAEHPTNADALRLLAHIALDHGNPGKALEVLARAERDASADARILAQRARALAVLGRPDEAAAAVRAALGLQPDDALTLDTLGVVLSRLGDHLGALALYERATARGPGVASYQFNYGAALQFAGHFDRARAAYRRTLALDPAHYRALSSLAQLRRATPEDNDIAALTSLFDRVARDPDAALHVGHALAKIYEDLGDPTAALEWLARAKAAKRAQRPYDAALDAALFDSAIALVDALAPRIRPAETPPPVPAALFVVGMPRTGTTLIDRVLSSHPRVASAGELPDFARLVKRTAATPSPFVLDRATLDACTRLDLADVGRRYREVLRTHANGAAVVVDKMPLNVFFAPALLVALPESRVVCLRRHPMDTCLSNYRQLFATRNHYYDYALDLGDTARYYAGFARLTAALRAKLSAERFFEVDYDRFVANQESETRWLLERCGLHWDARCLAFHENDTPVATASAVQVRAPLYANASGRFRRYGGALALLATALREAGIDWA
jgi:tetratricopeptide (TPR) repeat protein